MTEPGGRHKLEVTPLVVGLVSIAAAVLALLSRAGADIDALVVLATLWVVVGVVGATRGIYRLMTSGRTTE